MHPWPKPRFPSLFSGAVDLKGPSPPPNKKRKKVPALDSLPARPRPRALALKPSHRTPAPPPSQHRSPENWLSLTDRGILALVGALVACPGTKRGFKSSQFNPIEGHVSMPWVSLLMNPPDVTASAPNGCVGVCQSNENPGFINRGVSLGLDSGKHPPLPMVMNPGSSVNIRETQNGVLHFGIPLNPSNK